MDYSEWRPSSASDLDGAAFVCRYLSNDSSKNLTRAEAETLTSWGLQIVANWESTGTGGDYNQGVADAQTARSQALAAGMPAGRPIYFSIDEDVAVDSQLAYFQGVGSILPSSEVGVYGSAAMVQGIQAAGWAGWGWRTMSTSWSGGASTTGCQLVQTTGGAGGNFDWDEALADDYGQWNLNTSAAPTSTSTTTVPVNPTSKEDDMSLVDASKVVAGVNGGGSFAGLGWSGGSAADIQVVSDGSLGVLPSLRVVYLLTTGPLVVVVNASNWVNGRITARLSEVVPIVANCFGVVVQAVDGVSTPFWLYSNGE